MQNNKPIHAIIFDLDDTLYTMQGIHQKAIAAVGQYVRMAFGMSEEDFMREYYLAMHECMDEMPKNATSHSRLIWAQRFCENLGYNPFLHAPEMEDAYYQLFLGSIRPKPGAIEFLRRVRERGIRTALCTDMQIHIQHKKIRRLGLEELLDAMVCSDVSGVDKPDPHIYRMTLERLGCRPEEAVMVGDNLTKDVYGPAAISVEGIWFNDQGRPEEGVTAPIVHDYRELWELLAGRMPEA
ncbi:MAG: HAD family hydrolase [Firmicutes bacterium]|nr:HAD family hydrolase [Bacillota bacterium]